MNINVETFPTTDQCLTLSTPCDFNNLRERGKRAHWAKIGLSPLFNRSVVASKNVNRQLVRLRVPQNPRSVKQTRIYAAQGVFRNYRMFLIYLVDEPRNLPIARQAYGKQAKVKNRVCVLLNKVLVYTVYVSDSECLSLIT